MSCFIGEIKKDGVRYSVEMHYTDFLPESDHMMWFLNDIPGWIGLNWAVPIENSYAKTLILDFDSKTAIVYDAALEYDDYVSAWKNYGWTVERRK